jgi:hypothetical protein
MDDKRYMKITLNEVALDKTWAAHLASVQVTDSTEQLDSVSFTFELPEGTGASLISKLDILGKTWKVELMDGSTVKKEYSGDILSIGWSRTGGAPRQVTINGVDQLHRLKRGRTAPKKGDRRFPGKKASEIITAVAGDWKLDSGDIQATDSALPYFEWKGDDAALLKYLAEISGYVVRLDSTNGKGALQFAKHENYANGDVTLVFGVDILDISADHNINGCVTSVTYATTDPQKGEAPTTGSKDHSVLKSDNTGKSGPEYLALIGSFPQPIEQATGDRPTPSAIEEQAVGMMRSTADSFCTGTLKCRFNPNLTSGKNVTVKDAGWPFDGTFQIKDVKHSFDASGYSSTVTFVASKINAP